MIIRKEQLEVFATRFDTVVQPCEEAASPGKIQHTDPKTADVLIRKDLQTCAKSGIDAGKKIEGAAKIVGEPEWSQAGVAHYGKDVWVGHKVDSLNGFVDKDGNVWVHKDRGNPATVIHEGIHKYSNATLISKSQPLNEGVTEYFTRVVAAKENLAKGRRYYEENYQTSKALADLAGEKTLCDAYFGGDLEQLKTVVDKKQGAGTW